MELTVYLSVQIYLLVAIGLAAASQADEAEIGLQLARSQASETRLRPLVNTTTAASKPPNRSRISSNFQSEHQSNKLNTKSTPDHSDGKRRRETTDGVVQAARAARHVKRKLDQVIERVSQLDSIIAQDHSFGSGDKSQARQEDDSSIAEDDKSALNKEHWLAAPQEEQSNGASSGDADQSSESDEGGQNTNFTQTLSDHTVAAASTRWSAPVIHSVIPGRDQQQQQANQYQAASENASEQGNSDGKDASAATNESTQMDPDFNAIDQERSVSNASQEALASMMGVEWTPDKNYNYFSELNAKNHGGPSSMPTATPLHRVNNPGKFQNMTILNTDTDLVNSYSNNGAQLSTANISYPIRSSSASRGVPQAGDSEQTSATLLNNQPIRKNNSVMTYTVSNYGKSSRDLQQASTTSQPYYTQEQTWSPGRHINESLPDNELAHQQRHIQWPTLATPAPPAQSYTTQGQNTDQTQLGLPPSISNVPQATRYSDVMMPAGNSVDSMKPYNQHQHHQRSHRTSGNINNHNFAPTATTMSEIQLNGNDDSALSAHRYSMAQPESHAQHSDPSQRRRSHGSQRQLTTSTDTTIYEHQHQMQQPPPIDVYSSRVDSALAGPLVDSASSSALNTSASSMSAATTMAPTILSQDLKHRSTSNAMSIDDQMMNPYSSSSDGPSLSPMEAQQHQADSGLSNSFIGTASSDSTLPASFRPMQMGTAQVDANHYYSTSQADLQNQNMASSGHGSDGAVNYLQDGADSANQQDQHQALMGHPDNRANEMSVQDQQTYLNAQAAMSNRPYGQGSYYQQQPMFSAPTSIQDAIQQAGASGNAESGSHSFSRPQQQQISAAQMASAIGDYNAQVHRYQQRQLALAAHLAQQQQLQRALEHQQQHQSQVTSGGQQSQRSLVSPLQSLVRAYYSTPSSLASLDQQPSESSTNSLASAIQSSMVKRYSPETTLANYLTARSSQSGNYATDLSASQPAYSFYQPQSQPQQQQKTTNSQQLYLPLTYNPAALKASLAQVAYQRLLSQASANNNPQASATMAQLGQLTPSYLANLQSVMANAQQTQQSSAGSNMLATAAMPQPVFYEAPSQMSQQPKADGATNYLQDDSGHSNTRAPSGSSSTPSTSGSSGSTSSRRSYLANLFKPSASSRYHYAPILLSPISLSPTSLGHIYAPTSAAVSQTGTDTSGALAPALGQFYANPYALAAAMSQTGLAHSASHPFSHHAQQHHHQTPANYQDAQSLVAQQYQQALAAAAAASALQPHYISAPAPQALDTEVAESSMVPSESSGSYTSPSDSQSSNSNSDSSDSPATKSGGSMKQWLTVASLLAGILPMGLVMASMLPMLSITGRKKRELEFSARNFYELFGGWKPSKILSAIMSASNDTIGLVNASRIINELTGSASDRLQPSSDIVKFDQGKFVNNKTARLLGPQKTATRYQLLASTTQKPPAAINGTVAQDSSIALNLPPHGTTPLPNVLPPLIQSNPIKSTVKKVIERVNNLIVTANKRKHRSSPVDTQWSWPQAAGGLPNFLRNVFEFNEVKKYLAELVRAKLIASAQATNNQPLLNYLNGVGQHSAPIEGEQTISSPTQPVASGRASPDQFQPQLSVKSNKRPQATATNELDVKPTKSQLAQTISQIHITTNQINQNNSTHLKPINATKPIQTDAYLGSPGEGFETLKQNEGDSKKRSSLLVCLQNVLCDLAGKLRKASSGQNSRNGTRTEADDRQMTRAILSQLIDYIVEADRETQIFGHDLRRQSQNGHNEEFIGLIQEAVLKQKCANTFVCLDPHKFRRIFAELKWPKRK